MLNRRNEIKSKGDGFFTSSVSNHIIILFLFYACSQCNAHIEDLFTLSFQLSAVRCGTNLERESTHHLPSGLAGVGVAQRNATQRIRPQTPCPCFPLQKWKACPGVRLHYQAEQQAANFGARHKTTKEEPNKEPRPGARNGKEEEIKKRNRKEQKGKEGATGASANHH